MDTIAALVPECVVIDLPLGRTLIMIIIFKPEKLNFLLLIIYNISLLA